MQGNLNITSARILTGFSERPTASSMSIRGGRIVAMDQSPAQVGDALSLNLGGRTVVPGLIDAHMHLLLGGRSLEQLDLAAVTSREEFEAALDRRHRDLEPDAWLIAAGWSEDHIRSGERPTRHWLAACGERPVVCYRMDHHVAVVNDAVLRLCDLSVDPPGGLVDRDPTTGEPTGVMIESALWQLVNPIVPGPTTLQKRAHLRGAVRHLHRLGLTTVGTMEYGANVRETYLPEREHLSLRCRITLLDRDWPLDFAFGQGFENDERLAVVGYKTYVDGTLGSRTARLKKPYADDPENRGILLELAGEGRLREWARAVVDAGFSPSMHAIGDEAARLALDAIAGIDHEARLRIEHAQQIDRADLARFRNVVVSMQPLHKYDDGPTIEARLGRTRLGGSFAFRSLIEHDAVLAFGSDWPIVSADPVAGMRCAITGLTRDGQPLLVEENVSPAQALSAYTRGAAWALGFDDVGVLRPGAMADLVVLDVDPLSTDWVDAPPTVLKTLVGGTVVYDALAAEPDSEMNTRLDGGDDR